MSANTTLNGHLVTLQEKARILQGLIEAMDHMADLLGPKGTPLYACIVSALPHVGELTNGLDSVVLGGLAK